MGVRVSAAEPADVILRGGDVRTMDEARPHASAIAVRGDRIVALDDVAALIGPKTRIIELRGATVVPSLTDAHAHLASLGLSLERLDLRGCSSAADCAARVKPGHGEWILGRGWDQNRFADKSFPTHAALDRVAPKQPVWLTRVDGHAGWANGEALRRAGISRDSKDPAGGRIVRDASGEPTGVLVDDAMDLIGRVVPKPGAAELEAAILRAQQVALSCGLVEIHEMGIDAATIAVYEKLAREGKLALRIYAFAAASEAERLLQHAPDQMVGSFTLRGIKLFADGALGSRGAALLAPYSDDAKNSGLILTPRDQIEKIARAAVAKGWQIAVHAIGDRANRDVLDAFERAGAGPRQRFRIEHAQVVAPADFARFAKLGVIASMQPTHAISDGPWAESRIGKERMKGAYAWRTMLENRVHLAFGSDFPVEEPSVVAGLAAAASKLTQDEALHGFTAGAAFAAIEEERRGRAAPGMAADLSIFDGKFPEWKPRATMVAGKIAWSALPEKP
jgi:predicted amidohydrolase YtcJ